MQRACLISLVASAAAAYAAPSATDRAIVAMMRLAEEKSYAWSSSVTDDARTYEIDGRTDGRFSRVQMPAINTVRRRLGRDSGDTRIDMIFLGNVACVIRTDTGWLRPDELPEREAISDFERLGRQARTGGSAGTGGTPGSIIPRTPGASPPPPSPRYSNLQLALSPPHQELAVIVSSHQELSVTGDEVRGTLTEVGARLLLVRDGQNQLTPLRAAGTFRVSLRNGTVVRYQVTLDGTLRVSSPSGGSAITIEVHQRATTEIRDIGTARFEVPEVARHKLGAG